MIPLTSPGIPRHPVMAAPWPVEYPQIAAWQACEGGFFEAFGVGFCDDAWAWWIHADALTRSTRQPSTRHDKRMSKRTLYIAAYDISDADRLRDALYVLKGYASGGQKSVFECFLTEPEKNSLVEAVKSVIDVSEDRFFLVRLDPRMRVRVMGIAVEPVDPEFFYIT